MNSFRRITLHILVASFWLAGAGTLALNAQASATPQTVPITNDTPAQTTRPETTPVSGSGAAGSSATPISKSQMKEQRKQQKTAEKAASANSKAANANAKAARANAKARKQTDKATQAQEKAAQPQ